MPLQIKGFIETSLLDWDGKVVAVLYVPGCNLRCPFCHNFGLIENPQNYDTISHAKIEKYLLEHKDFMDGICLTGGEPCLHKCAGLFEFLARVKERSFLVKIDTNGTDSKCIADLIGQRLVDYIAMDIKGPLARYEEICRTKVDVAEIKKSIQLIFGSSLPYEFRTTVVPTLLDLSDIKVVAKEIAGANKFVLQQFTPREVWDSCLLTVKPYSREELEEMKKEAQKYVPNTLIRGA